MIGQVYLWPYSKSLNCSDVVAKVELRRQQNVVCSMVYTEFLM